MSDLQAYALCQVGALVLTVVLAAVIVLTGKWRDIFLYVYVLVRFLLALFVECLPHGRFRDRLCAWIWPK